jgi:hypothetical protein
VWPNRAPKQRDDELPPLPGPGRAPKIGGVVATVAIVWAGFSYEKRTYVDINSGAEKLVRAVGPVVLFSRIESTQFSRAVERHCVPLTPRWEIVKSYGLVNSPSPYYRHHGTPPSLQLYSSAVANCQIPEDLYITAVRDNLRREEVDSIDKLADELWKNCARKEH